MKAKLKTPFKDINGCLYEKDCIISDIDLSGGLSVLSKTLIKSNPAIFELIEDEPEYLRILRRTNIDSSWSNDYIGRIFKISKRHDRYHDNYYVYFNKTKDKYVLSEEYCEAITKSQYIDYLKEKQTKLSNLINKLEHDKSHKI